MKNPFASDPGAVAAGKLLFEQTCQSCHGSEARGDRGPALTSNSLKHGNQDMDIFQTIRTGVPGTQMPAFTALPSDSVWRIISYLRSLNPSRGGVNEQVPGDASAGQELFNGKGACNTCHEVNGTGGIVGPDLSATGMNSVEYLHNWIVKPNEASPRSYRSRGPSSITVKTRDGKEIRGVLIADDGYTLIVRDIQGTIRRFNVSDLLDRQEQARSLMPDNYAQTLTSSQIENLVAYLKTLKAPDFARIAQAKIPGGLSFESLRHANAEPRNWPTYWGDYQGDHFSPLAQITPANVKKLEVSWAMQMPGDTLLEATPLVVDGILYTSGEPGQVFAVDAKSGLQIWKFERRQKVLNPYQTNPFNRGVAVLGNRVFFGTLDAALVALDARTGRKLWETQVADTLKGYTITSAPLAIKDKIIVGVAGGEFGIRGFVDAYDAATGKRLWRFNTIPGPGEFGNKTWSGDSWKQGSGATWLTGSYDPDLNLLYWTVGNPGPDLNPSVREGDNLFTSSVLALDPETGTRKWHYQFTPNDSHDWDANQDVILADRTIDGRRRKVLIQADRNGMFYVLDRTDGKLIFAKPYVKETWNSGFDANGHPILVPGWKASPEGVVVYPTGVGGTNWQSPSYDPERSLLYVVARDGAQGYRSVPVKYEAGRQYMGGGQMRGGPGGLSGSRVASKNDVVAIDTENGTIKWSFPLVRGSYAAGVLGTRAGLVFAATGEGSIIALDGTSGKSLWHFQTGSTITSSPISYAIDGKQYVALTAGNVLYTFTLPE